MRRDAALMMPIHDMGLDRVPDRRSAAQVPGRIEQRH
jgi:hypothetical protein